MANATIDRELARSFEHGSAELIASVRNAINEFYANLPQGWEAWETWRTPKPWEARVLPNLERYHSDLKTALRAYHVGDILPITHAAASYAGLSKDLEFDMRWMTDQNRATLKKCIQELVMVADRIHHLGYEALRGTGSA